MTEPVDRQPEMVPRRAARVLLLDAADRVLLLRGFDPAQPEHRYWFTVGGGLDDGESMLEAAVRELFEETGLRLTVDDLTGPVWRETTRFPFDGQWYVQEQEFFLARTPDHGFEVDSSGLNEVERASVDGSAWWSPEDLDATAEQFYPTDLATVLRTVSGLA
jgi:8-oxo-dGTP pyrophosphatase MutT (NUDIX family)